MMRRLLFGLAAVAACAVPAWGQTHAVKKPDEVVRAVAVYEWTGEEGKPTASRVVPVSLFIDGQFQDAGIYMARPVPFALDTGTVYEVRKSGVDAGTLELVYERHLTSGDTAEIDDGWLGYGQFKVKPKETLLARNQSRPVGKLVVSGKETASDSGGPKLVSRSGSAGGASSSSGSNSSKSTGSQSAGSTVSVDADDEDSNSPTSHRRAGSAGDATTTAPTGSAAGTTPTASTSTASNEGTTSGSGSGTSTASGRGSASSTDADDDAERPTLKRRTPAEIKANKKQKDSARVVAGNDLNDDPDRPTLHRGSKTTSEEEEVPPLRGTPKDMKQLVAVSDAKDRPEHDFVRPWQSESERIEVLGKMQAFAREQLAAYKGVGPAIVAPVAASPSAPSKPLTAAQRAAARRKAAAATSAPPSPLPLNDEVLKGYTLSYGGAATYLYSATSPGANGVSRCVAVVAQEEPTVGLKMALANVTDSSHLDRTPWMRPVDVVDADASNRASLLVELRAQHTRQFALYRVIGAQADQIFLSGSTE